jgi:hypothetical protein
MLTELRQIWLDLAFLALLFSLAGMLWMTWQRLCAVRSECQRERRGREEMEAYTRMDLRLSTGDNVRDFARRICSVVAARSSFDRVAMLRSAVDGGLYVLAQDGMDDATAGAVETWLSHAPGKQGGTVAAAAGADGAKFGDSSSVIRLEIEEGRPATRAILIPIMSGEQRLGALLVCADSIFQVPRRLAQEAVIGLEALSVKIARQMERLAPERQQYEFERQEGDRIDLRTEPWNLMLGQIAGAIEEAGISAQNV